MGVFHKDIRPENIMITDNGTVKLIDFGITKFSKPAYDPRKVKEPLFYSAPEVLNGQFGAEADLWAVGVVLYTLMSGYLPFQAPNTLEMFQKIKDGDFHFKHKEFQNVSDECKDLISKLL